MVKSARKRIETGKDTLVDQFLAFMEKEFDEKFDALLTSSEKKAERQESARLVEPLLICNRCTAN